MENEIKSNYNQKDDIPKKDKKKVSENNIKN